MISPLLSQRPLPLKIFKKLLQQESSRDLTMVNLLLKLLVKWKLLRECSLKSMIWNVDLVLCNLLNQFLRMLSRLYKKLLIFAEWEEKLSFKLVESSKMEQSAPLNSCSVVRKISQFLIRLLLNLLMLMLRHKVLLNLDHHGLMFKLNKKLTTIAFKPLELTSK